MNDPSKLGAVEKVKLSSNALRGDIAAELANERLAFEQQTAQLLEHHGMYQQDDLDRHDARGLADERLGKVWSLMVRVKIPGGVLNHKQFLAQLNLCDTLGNGTLRITNRQGLQLHGVLKKKVRQAIQRINEVQWTTLGACGDVERNVLCCPTRITAIRDTPRCRR